EYGDTTVVELINDSIASNYMGIVWDKIRASPNQERSNNDGVYSKNTSTEPPKYNFTLKSAIGKYDENGDPITRGDNQQRL
ncbi:MAG: hypothetical protein FWG63_00415, partial [Defluviitaleaceae bacterium]|nr:hypothetical protein [Defluviitaleaceae bacterium]